MRRRVIKDLKEVELLDKKPPFIPDTKHRGSRKAGLVYEQKVIKHLKGLLGYENVLGNIWFKFHDSRGTGYCSPDFIVPGDPFIIGECKLTVTNAAERKLRHIYKPVAQKFFQIQSVKMIQVAKNLTVGWDDIQIYGLEDIYDKEAKWDFATWIWRL